MSNVFQFMPISQIAEKFPDNSWWSKYYKDFNDEHLVAYYEGDLTLPSLNLDWHMPFPQQEEVLLLFINGNFTVDNLYNRETDGAIGLMVTGNLSAQNIAVGGQEIFVAGNVMVAEILCGSYNHGEMIVEGNLNAKVLVQDGEYRFNVDGQQSIVCSVNVWDTVAVCCELPIDIREVLVDDVFLDIEEEEIDFSFHMLVTVLEEGRSAVLNWNKALQQKKGVPLYFTQNTIHEENILKLTQCILMTDDKPYFDFEEHDAYFKVQREYIDADGDKQNANIYIETTQHRYFIYLNDDQSVSLLMKTGVEGDEWGDITEKSPDHLAELSEYWIMLLTCVNVAELYLPNIEVKYMQDILQHPVIQELDPYGEENDGFWDGSKYYGFRRQAYTDEDGYCFAARIDIETPDGAFYFYTLDNDAYVSRYYQPPNHHARQDMPFLDAKRSEASERYFDRFKQFISQKMGATAGMEDQ
ncbi:hypothetical protein [Paenibacillus aquistagni]|uniref:hypothetical protein n=1 Tax=Paenibacillus aquistagni TaxID=1852522 RepID=UPI000B50DE8F|nr:hypothetical protein [Paenibacillus aquistagni]